MNFGYFTTFQSLDKGLIERVGPTGFTVSTFSLSSNFASYNSGLVYHTTFLFIGFTVLFLAFFVLGSFGLLTVFNMPFILLFVSYTVFSIADPRVN
jgi:hypothetical protein